MKKHIIIIVTFLISSISFSQINELGVYLGGSNYIGDVGSTTYINPKDFTFGLIYKWNYSPRLAFRAEVDYINLSGDDALSNNEVRQARGFSFKNKLYEISAGIEFNYYNYSMIKTEWRSTPYLILEVAAFSYSRAVRQTGLDANGNPVFETEITNSGFTIPFGIGYKTTLGSNIGIAFETKFRYSFKDDLDFNNKDIPSLNFGNPDSDDWYVTTGITIVFGFGRKGCYAGGF
jgi:hypothetical protein